MSEDKIWVNAAFFKKKMFEKGGHIHTMYSPNVDELCAWLQANKKQNNTIAINISGSREPRLDEKGNEKLNASLDTWEPQQQQQQAPAQVQYQAPPAYAPPAPQYQQPQMPQQPQNNVQAPY